jgi:hypothetical protein
MARALRAGLLGDGNCRIGTGQALARDCCAWCVLAPDLPANYTARYEPLGRAGEKPRTRTVFRLRRARSGPASRLRAIWAIRPQLKQARTSLRRRSPATLPLTTPTLDSLMTSGLRGRSLGERHAHVDTACTSRKARPHPRNAGGDRPSIARRVCADADRAAAVRAQAPDRPSWLRAKPAGNKWASTRSRRCRPLSDSGTGRPCLTFRASNCRATSRAKVLFERATHGPSPTPGQSSSVRFVILKRPMKRAVCSLS